MERSRRGVWRALIASALAVAACAGPISSELPATAIAPSFLAESTSSVTPSSLTTLAPQPTGSEPSEVESLAWAAILDLPQVVGQYTIRAYDDAPTYLHVFADGGSVGRIFSRAYSDSAIAIMGNVETPEGLRSLAAGYVDQLRADRRANAPDQTFEAIGPVDFAFANVEGVKLGWTLTDQSRVTERFLMYLVPIPGGLEWFQAAYMPGDTTQGSFPRDQDLTGFMASLDEVMADVRIPVRP